MSSTIELVRSPDARRGIYELARMKFGREAQLFMAIEELGELQVEIAKLLGSRLRNLDDLYSEIADAEIMIEQLRLMFSGAHIDVIKEKKLARLEAMVSVPDALQPLGEGE